MTTAAGPGDDPGLRMGTGAARWVLLATILGSAVAAIDASVVGIALPTIGRDFDAPLSSLQWVVTAYLMTLAGLLLVGGGLGDRYGRRRVFVIGVVWFAAASLLCGIAPNVETLIAARALQGVGGALLVPGSLAILQASFAEEARGRAIGAWSGLGGVATALGPFLGGWLVQSVSWRLIFLLNLPPAVLVVVIATRHVPETRARAPAGRLDVLGGVAVTASLVGLTYGLVEGPGRGWDSPPVLGSLAAAVVLGAAFVVRERSVAEPILPLEVFRSRQFSGTNLVTFVVYAALGGALFLLPVQLQQVSHYSPMESGVSLLPLTAVMLALSARSGAVAARIGPRLQMSLGPLLVAAGLLLMTRIGPDGDYVRDVLPAVLVLGLGLATTVAPLTATALAAAPPEHSGIASAVNNDVARAAALVAVALLPAAAGITGSAYEHPAALDHGFGVAMVISAVTCAVGGALAALLIRNDATAVGTERGHRACALDAPPAVGGEGPGLPRRAFG
jgi:EmrB/QacA subfamily drug resistance transporter